MQKLIPAILAVALCFSPLVPSLLAQPTFSDASFETPSLGACPAAANTASGLSGTPWIFTDYAGITTGGCALLLNAPSPPPGGGTQMGYIQASPQQNPPVATASLSQTVSGFVAGHNYTITFWAAGRPPNGGCNDNCTELSFSVFVGSVDVLDVVNPPTNAFQQYTTRAFSASGSVNITFTGTSPDLVDRASFIDLLSIQDIGLPTIGVGGIVSASAFGEFAAAAPGAWIEIYGTNLATDTRGWTLADFSGINAPTSLDGTHVTIAGQQAFVDYISSGQVNALIPSNVPTGTQQLTVTTPAGTTAPYSLTINAVEPGLLAPPNFNVSGTQYVVAQYADGTYVLPTGAVSGLTSRPAKPGDIIVIYGVGFGPVTPDIPAGQLVGEANSLASDFHIFIGGQECQVQYDGLAPNYTGLYQLNIVVSSGLAGAVPLTFTVGGVAGTQTLYVAIGD